MAISRNGTERIDSHFISQSRLLLFEMCFKVIYRSKYAVRIKILLLLLLLLLSLLSLLRTLTSAIPMVTMAQSAGNWRNTHTHIDSTHSLTHFSSTHLQLRGAKRQLSCYCSVRAGSFRVSIIHRTLTWTILSSSTCVRGHFCAYVYTRGLGTPTASQHNMFDSEKLTNCSCTPGTMV